MISIKLTGAWGNVGKGMKALPANFLRMRKEALRGEAEFFKKKIVEGLRSQAPGGQPLKPLSPFTVAMRSFLGIKSQKMLIEHGDLLRSITVVEASGDRFMVGVKKGSVNSDGHNLVKIGAIHEYGAGPFVIRLTPKMRAFLATVFRRAGITKRSGRGNGSIVVTIPPRPFLGPVFEEYGTPERSQKRMAQRMSLLMKSVTKR